MTFAVWQAVGYGGICTEGTSSANYDIYVSSTRFSGNTAVVSTPHCTLWRQCCSAGLTGLCHVSLAGCRT